MAYADLLINTCTVRRATGGVVDVYGNPTEAWADHLVDQKCRWSSPTHLEVKFGAEVVIIDIQLFLEDIDVTEKDRVILGADAYEVLSVFPRQNGIGDHHKEALLKRVAI